MNKLTLGGSMMGLALGIAMATASGAWAQEPTLSKEEKDHAKDVYFQRCAGCHGVLRKGATGKSLEPSWKKTDAAGVVSEGGTLKLGQSRLEKIIALGTDGGMVNFDDILTKDEIKHLATYVQMPPDTPPEWGMKDMLASWKNIVPVDKRPTKPMNKINLKNVFSVTLRDAGEVALSTATPSRSSRASRPATPCTSRGCRPRADTSTSSVATAC